MCVCTVALFSRFPPVLVLPPVEIVPLYFLESLPKTMECLSFVSFFFPLALEFLPFTISHVPIFSTSEKQLFSDLTKFNWQLLASDCSRGCKQLNVMYHHLWQNPVCVTTNVQITSNFLSTNCLCIISFCNFALIMVSIKGTRNHASTHSFSEVSPTGSICTILIFHLLFYC